MDAIRTHVVRELRLEDGFVAAASGLARSRGRLYVAADDELALAVFAAGTSAPGRRLHLADEQLPADPAERKARKPDLEAICALPAGGLLALGSGSSPRRHRGFVVSLDGEEVRELSLRRLHEAVDREVEGPLNLEGAEWHAGNLLLAQRGTHGSPSAIVRVSWPALELLRIDVAPAHLLDGVPLGITDLARLPDGRLLAAYAAEATTSAYHDGAIAGSALGILGEHPRRLDGPWKVEGLWSDGREVLMVTDADDPGRPAVLLRALLPPA